MSSPSASIDAFLAGPQSVRKAVAGMNRDQLRSRPIPGKWSTLEVVCHLVDSDQAWLHRMKRIIAEDKPLLIGYDERRFAAALGYHDRDIEEELALLENGRRQMGHVLRQLPAEAFSRTGIHSELGSVTLAECLRLEADHIPHHLRFIDEKRGVLGLGR